MVRCGKTIPNGRSGTVYGCRRQHCQGGVLLSYGFVGEDTITMARTDFKSVNEYIASKPRNVRGILTRLRTTIRKAVPAAEEVIRKSHGNNGPGSGRCRPTLVSTFLFPHGFPQIRLGLRSSGGVHVYIAIEV